VAAINLLQERMSESFRRIDAIKRARFRIREFIQVVQPPSNAQAVAPEMPCSESCQTGAGLEHLVTWWSRNKPVVSSKWPCNEQGIERDNVM